MSLLLKVTRLLSWKKIITSPPDSINRAYFEDSDTHTHCPWKGQASYYDIVVEGERHEDAAWYYPKTREKAAKIKDHVAFWKGVEVVP